MLQVNTSYQHGGGETVARQLQAGCARAGHQSALMVAYGKTFPRGAAASKLRRMALSATATGAIT